MRKRILIITDSLGLPRNGIEKIPVTSTWPYLIKQSFIDFDIEFVQCRGMIIRHIYDASWHYEDFNPDIVFIQSGIVDCAPRAFTRYEQELIKILPFQIPKKIIRLLRKYRKSTHTPPGIYFEYLEKFSKLFKNSNLFFIEILPPSQDYEKNVRGITQNIHKYNELIYTISSNKDFVNIVKTNTFSEKDILSDFHHLSESGNKKLSDIIIEVIKNSIHN